MNSEGIAPIKEEDDNWLKKLIKDKKIKKKIHKKRLIDITKK